MIRSHVGQQFNSEQFNSEQFNTVPKEGLEPSHPKAQEPKSCVSTSSTTPAQVILPRSLRSLGADRAWNPPTSSSFADKKRVGSLLLSTARRDPGCACLASLGAAIELQMEVVLELVDMTRGLHVVLRDRDGAVALLVDVDNKG